MGRITDVVKHLLIINVILFLATMVLKQYDLDALLALWFPYNPNFGVWQYITHMFMHGGFTHILFNMYALWAFGTPIEQMWGKNKFLFFYISAGLGAALLHTGVNYYYFQQGLDVLAQHGVESSQVIDLFKRGMYDTDWEAMMPADVYNSFMQAELSPMVGASGAIYGILVAFAMMFPNSELMLIFFPVPVKAKYFIPGLIALDLFSGISGSSVMGGNIAHFAHIGGAIAGFLMFWYWKKNQFKNNRWD